MSSLSPLEAVSPVEWRPDEYVVDCGRCALPFSMVVRRHHCRLCGNLFCGRCSKASLPLRTTCGTPTASSSSETNSPRDSPRECRVCLICAELTSYPRGFAVTPDREGTVQCKHNERYPSSPLCPPLFLYTLLFLPPSSYEMVAKVSKRCYNLVNQPLVWKRVAAILFPNLGVKVSLEAPESIREASTRCMCVCCGFKPGDPTGNEFHPMAVQRSSSGSGRAASLPPNPDPPTAAEQRETHASLLQRQNPPGYFTLELPQYLKNAPSGSTFKRHWAAEGDLEVKEPGTGNTHILQVVLPVEAVRNWYYFVHEKLLEVAYRDFEYPVNTSLFTGRQVVNRVLLSLEARLRRKAMPADVAVRKVSERNGSVMGVYADPTNPPPVPPVEEPDHAAVLAGRAFLTTVE